ncbi:uncharacterized protein IL334_000158 [Kwoniella shivajii]|uniref:Mitotic checkpoint regulator, MAD2B-interacting-domain-containing protein n=1 Tax=Kwoniella shivajii TaxID=564305 RepID=A0ABZ1CNR0_9TREE|nr:hypothetical protein IL334_000158 [Kwoniella shivajii]
MLLANYASDSDSDDGSDNEPTLPTTKTSTSAIAKPPININTVVSKPVVGKAKKPIKITLGLPKSAGDDVKPVSGQDEEDGISDGERERKKPKIAGGKGGSSLLGMLPPPKRKLPSAAISKGSSLKVNKSMANSASSSSASPSINVPKPLLASTKASTSITNKILNEDDDDEHDEKFLPLSLSKKAQAQKGNQEEFDLFGLSLASAVPPISSVASSSSSSSVKPPSISSAPLAPDYVPPEPTSNDPYPGYYQLPSGEWRAYDPAYYTSFFSSSSKNGEQQDEEDDGRIGKHWKDFDNGRYGGNVVEISAMKGLEEARKEEERRNLSKKPKFQDDSFEYKPLGQVKGLASQRHQLTSLLDTAYTQREELEDRIAQNKKNMRMAGTKYGF